MQISKTVVTKLYLSEMARLDPISVFLEDHEPGKGKIVIECFGSSWAATWSAMGKRRNVASFFCDSDAEYLIGSLAPGMRAESFTGTALKALAVKTIEERRDGASDMGMLNSEEAAKLMDEAESLEGYDSLWDTPSDLMEAIFGCEWRHYASDATEPSASYIYLTRIIEAVQEGLKEAGLAATA